MTELKIAFLGDICGSPGRMVVRQQLPRLREEHQPDVVIANAENAKAGSGLSPDLYRKIREMGIDGLTMGDHVYRDSKIVPILASPEEPISRPANLSAKAQGKRFVRIPPGPGRNFSIIVITVLGRIYLTMPSDDPFATVDRMLGELPEADPMVIVEVHAEATSEKAALAHYLDGRVSMVVGTHTHVPTADARILPHGTAFITDLGMCGPYHSIIGRDVSAFVQHMTTAMPIPFTVATGQESMCGVVARIDCGSRRALSIERVQYDADMTTPPFSDLQGSRT
jgi:metallophosphoesterase (TIGR00282 family)